MEDPFFSIIVLVRDMPHLLTLTIKSILNQTFNRYEIIVIEVGQKKQVLDQLSSFHGKIHQMYSSEKKDLCSLLNHGVHFSNGKYIHFLYSGDVYLSSFSLQDLFDFFVQQSSLDFVSSLFLRKNEGSKPDAFSFPVEEKVLKKGQIFGILQSFLFSKDFLQKIKGFDERYTHRPLLSFFCFIFSKKKPSFALFKKVFFDYELRKTDPKSMFFYTRDTFLILYRYFGFFTSIFWFFSKERGDFIKLLLHSVKKIFYKPR